VRVTRHAGADRAAAPRTASHPSAEGQAGSDPTSRQGIVCACHVGTGSASALRGWMARCPRRCRAISSRMAGSRARRPSSARSSARTVINFRQRARAERQAPSRHDGMEGGARVGPQQCQGLPHACSPPPLERDPRSGDGEDAIEFTSPTNPAWSRSAQEPRRRTQSRRYVTPRLVVSGESLDTKAVPCRAAPRGGDRTRRDALSRGVVRHALAPGQSASSVPASPAPPACDSASSSSPTLLHGVLRGAPRSRSRRGRRRDTRGLAPRAHRRSSPSRESAAP